MLADPPKNPEVQLRPGWFSRERMQALALLAATVLAIVLLFLLVRPFLPALAYALAFAVVAFPLHDWLTRNIRNRTVAAGLSVTAVLIVLVGPMILLMRRMVEEAARALEFVREEAEKGEWREELRETPIGGRLLEFIEFQLDFQQLFQQLADTFGEEARAVVVGSLWGLLQILVAIFILFYFFRDNDRAMGALRSLVPLSNAEAEDVFRRVADTIYATVYGTVAVSLVKGGLGGLSFWVLGLPGPVLWGAVMFLLSVIPIVGPFLVWGPAAVFLAFQGEWVRAIILTAWGSIVVGLADNVLYPMLVGHRLRIHTVPVFFSILGGLIVFGASGIVLGPVILAVTIALVEIWRRRTAGGLPAEDGVDGPLELP